MQRKYRFEKSLAWVAVVTSIVLAGCGGNNGTNQDSGGTASDTQAGNPTAGTSEAVTKVTIGYNPTIALPQALLGVDGEFAKSMSGVSFDGKVFAGGADVVEQLRAGNLDIGYSGPIPPLKAYLKSGDIVLLGGAAKGGTELMVAKSSAIKSVKDLKGKAIGVNTLGSTAEALVRYNLIKAGLDPAKDVKITRIEPADQADALKSGDAAAVAAPAPWPSVIAISGNGRPLLDAKQILENGNYLTGVVFTTKKFADAHPDFIKQFLAAHRAITERLNKDRAKGDAEVLAAWSKVTKKKMEPAVAKAAFASIEYTDEVDPKTIERDADITFQVGFLRKKGDVSGFLYQAP